MINFFRWIYVRLTPIPIFFVSVLATAFIVTKLTAPEPFQERFRTAIEQHMAKSKTAPITVFNGYLFLVNSQIKSGQVITPDALVKQEFGSSEPNKHIQYLEKSVVGNIAVRDLHKEQLVFANDLRTAAKSARPMIDDGDAQVKDHDNNGKQPLMVFEVLLVLGPGLVGALLWIFGRIRVIRLAFQEGVIAGLFALINPWSTASFELRNWSACRTFVHLGMIGLVLIGFTCGVCSSAKARQQDLLFAVTAPDELEALSRKEPVVYTTKPLKAGQIISVNDLVVRNILTSRIPQDALSKEKQAIGKKAKYDNNAGVILSSHDVR